MFQFVLAKIDALMRAAHDNYGVDPVVFLVIYLAAVPVFYYSLFRMLRALAEQLRNEAVVWSIVFLCAIVAPFLYVLVFGRNLPWWVYGVIASLIGQGVLSLAVIPGGSPRPARNDEPPALQLPDQYGGLDERRRDRLNSHGAIHSGCGRHYPGAQKERAGGGPPRKATEFKIPQASDEMGGDKMFRRCLLHAAVVLSLAAAYAFGQAVPVFNASGLVKLGDTMRYGSYEVIKIGDGIYQLKDSGDPRAQKGGLIGIDMYLICGTTKALLIDLGNNYIDGYAGDAILPRKNAAEELRAVVDGLIGKLPLEIAITHAHPDHDGMTGAFLDRKTVIWMPKGEDLEAPRKQHKIDPAVYTTFDHQTKTFDLGGGRVVKPLLVRGHSNGCTVYLLPSEMMLFTR